MVRPRPTSTHASLSVDHHVPRRYDDDPVTFLDLLHDFLDDSIKHADHDEHHVHDHYLRAIVCPGVLAVGDSL